MTKLQEKLIESTINSIIIMIISLIITFFIAINISNVFFISISFLGGIALFTIYIKKPYKREHMLINSWICMICVLFIGNFIGEVMSLTSIISLGVAIAIVDIISFTQIGLKAPSAKTLRNKNLMVKLMVYGKSLKSDKIIPAKGLGDIIFYTILISGIYKFSHSPYYVFYGECLIFLGCMINWCVDCLIYNKEWYKGFPATFIPFICILPIYMKFIH